ncbi:MAG: RNA polymerase sigma factor [Lachnospirales bacterium]
MGYLGVDELNDFEIVQLCIKDSMYFEVIVDRYKNLVFSVINKMISDYEESRDLSQEVFIKVYKNIHKYSPEFRFSTWIIKITTNHVIDYRRKQHYTTLEYDGNTHCDSIMPSAEDECVEKEKSKELETVIMQLPEEFRIPIVLFHREGLSYQEISNVLDIPLSKVKNRIFKGRKLLKESIESNRQVLRGDRCGL